MTLKFVPWREKLIEDVRIALDPSMEGIVRECYRIVEDTIRELPKGAFSDEEFEE